MTARLPLADASRESRTITWYDPFNPEDWTGVILVNGSYHPLQPDAQNRYQSQQLGLVLVQGQGVYKGVEIIWLRWATLDGELLPTAQELAEERANQAQQQAEQLATQLRELSIDPDLV